MNCSVICLESLFDGGTVTDQDGRHFDTTRLDQQTVVLTMLVIHAAFTEDIMFVVLVVLMMGPVLVTRHPQIGGIGRM